MRNAPFRKFKENLLPAKNLPCSGFFFTLIYYIFIISKKEAVYHFKIIVRTIFLQIFFTTNFRKGIFCFPFSCPGPFPQN